MLKSWRHIFPFICLLATASAPLPRCGSTVCWCRGKPVAFEPGTQLHFDASDDDLTFIFSSKRARITGTAVAGLDQRLDHQPVSGGSKVTQPERRELYTGC